MRSSSSTRQIITSSCTSRHNIDLHLQAWLRKPGMTYPPRPDSRSGAAVSPVRLKPTHVVANPHVSVTAIRRIMHITNSLPSWTITPTQLRHYSWSTSKSTPRSQHYSRLQSRPYTTTRYHVCAGLCRTALSSDTSIGSPLSSSAFTALILSWTPGNPQCAC